MNLSKLWPVLAAIAIVFAFVDKNEVTALADLDAKKPKVLKVSHSTFLCNYACGYQDGEEYKNVDGVQEAIDDAVSKLNTQSEGYFEIEKIEINPLTSKQGEGSVDRAVLVSIFYSVPKQAEE